MRIGYDVSQTGTEKAGCGHMADSLLEAMVAATDTNDYIVYPTFGDRYWDLLGPEATRRFTQEHVQLGLMHETPADAERFWRAPPADLEHQLGHPDVIHSNNFFCPSGLRHARLVYTLYDLSFFDHPDWTTEHNRQVCFDGVFRASLEADLIVAISAFSRDHFLRVFPHYPPNRVRVVHLGSRFSTPSADTTAEPSPPLALDLTDFFLFVGTLEPRKNPVMLVRAYERYVKQCTGVPKPLVLAGGRGWLTESLDEEIRGQGVADRVHRLGYVDDDTLAWLYRNCRAFVYPSRFEGFGLPVLEAMGHGAAVITSANSALPEVIGDAGLLVDAEDEAALANALEALATDDARCGELRRRALERAARFSWRRAADQVLSCYDDVIAMEKRARSSVGSP